MKIDVSKAVREDSVRKVSEAFEYLKTQKIEVGKIEIFGDSSEAGCGNLFDWREVCLNPRGRERVLYRCEKEA